MKKVAKWIISISVLVTVFALFFTVSVERTMAVHDRGALTCSNCHTMHFSMTDPNNPGNWGAAGPYPNLLIDTKTDNAICLACHDDRAADTSGAPTVYSVNNLDLTYFPGGDFNLVSAGGEIGHFKKTGVALTTDDTPATAPGSDAAGSVDSSELRCWSCHDPHNSAAEANDYRLLRKRPKDGVAGTNYVGADITVVASAAVLTADEAGTNHSVFRSGISSWCGACHSNTDNLGTGFHGSTLADLDTGDATNWLRHPTDRAFSAAYVTEYNDALAEDAWRVPMEDDDGTVWATNTADHAATTNNRVMCLSCHRAHVGRAPGAVATYYNDGLRWDTSVGLDPYTACNVCHNK